MTTTGELLNIIENLELVDIGDAAHYLGEEPSEKDAQPLEQAALLALHNTAELAAIDCASCPC